MPPAAAGYRYDWSSDSSNPCVNVDCLLPTGILVQLIVYKDATLADIKQDLWREAQRYPLYGSLLGNNEYVFVCINQTAEQEELVDETRRLCEVRPFQPILKVVKKHGNRAEKILNSQISVLIGKGLHEFDSMRNPEVTDFRQNAKKMVEQIAIEQSNKDWVAKVQYLYPLNICKEPYFSPEIASKLKDNKLVIPVVVENTQVRYTFRVPVQSFPRELLQLVLQKLELTTGTEQGNPEDFLLKVCGRDEFLIGEYPLSQFQYVRKSIMNEHPPQLSMISNSSIPDIEERIPPVPRRPPIVPRPSPRKSKTEPVTALWTVRDYLKITVNDVRNLNVAIGSRICVRMALYHGNETVSDIMNTSVKEWPEGTKKVFNEPLTFNILVQDVPRMAKLCCTLYTVIDRKKSKESRARKHMLGKQEVVPIAWVNIMMFDYKDKLQRGQKSLYMWPFREDLHHGDDILNHIGTSISNPHEDAATALSVTFHDYGVEHPIEFPSFATVLECAADNTGTDESAMLISSKLRENKHYLQQLQNIIELDPLKVLQIHENEKSLVWILREECRFHFPQESLPRLLMCVKWNSHVDVAQMQALLQIWPELEPERALELLDFAYADNYVRKFAVKCLQSISDADLLLYLLQLVQVLKYEAYLDCDLTEFLLRRALDNQKIGHHFFWLLKSEMHVPSVSVRFGVILEAYCRGAVQHIKSLAKQSEALEKLRSINVLVKGEQYNSRDKKIREKGIKDMRDVLSQNAYKDALSDLQCPLDPSLRLSSLRVQECKYMDSKMKPLWLVFKNSDPLGADINVIFKNGDDLRQDMLTLQILHIMDSIWQSEGLDLRMNPYGCVATGQDVGLIEVVTMSKTIANIQKKYSAINLKSAFNKDSLYLWLKECNKDAKSFSRALEEFTFSCAGYCVATYVLGIGDRHSDNIMLKETGQLFHIDFGHFLGNFKSKFGIKRERAPFVLTHDFVYVINRGKSTGEHHFQQFKKVCESAFMILRRRGNLLLTLFMMMLSTGIPELRCVEDIQYLSDTLKLDKSDDEALKHFQQKFNEALKNSWKTSFNWAAHNAAKDNK